MYPPDNPTRPCRPKAGQGPVMMMMIMIMMIMMVEDLGHLLTNASLVTSSVRNISLERRLEMTIMLLQDSDKKIFFPNGYCNSVLVRSI